MDKEKEILLIAQEECAEVTQAISKVFRFGFESVSPDGKNNRQHLEEEVGDLFCMIQLMIENDIVDQSAVYEASKEKRSKLKKWSNIFD